MNNFSNTIPATNMVFALDELTKPQAEPTNVAVQSTASAQNAQTTNSSTTSAKSKSSLWLGLVVLTIAAIAVANN